MQNTLRDVKGGWLLQDFTWAQIIRLCVEPGCMRDMRRSTCSVPNPSGVAEDRDFEDVFEYIRQEEEAEEDIVAHCSLALPHIAPRNDQLTIFGTRGC